MVGREDRIFFPRMWSSEETGGLRGITACLFLLFSTSPLAPSQAVLDDMAAGWSPDLCRRPANKFHVIHPGLAGTDGDPAIKQRLIKLAPGLGLADQVLNLESQRPEFKCGFKTPPSCGTLDM